MKIVIILGIDPGTTSIGYAAIDGEIGEPRLLTADLIRIPGGSTPQKLLDLHERLAGILKEMGPDLVAVERLFFAKNQKTAMAVAEARGVILLTSSLARIRVLEYTPLEVKKLVAGYGNVDKAQLKKAVILTLPQARNISGPDDVFDAIAIALACFYMERRKF